MPAFTGQLRANLIFAALFNMIISQEVFADNIQKHQTLVDEARVDGTLYGDQKLYYATDVLKTRPFLGDAEASNLLAINRPKTPEVQAIVMDVFRQIDVTIDNYLTKQAWTDEGSFASFTAVTLGWLGETRRVYDGTLYNVYIGTTVTSVGAQLRTVDVTTAVGSATGLEAARLEAGIIAEDLANLLVDMGDYRRSFNDYGFMRSYAKENLKIVWNAKYMNKIKNIDLPNIFHSGELQFHFDNYYMPAHYFGTVITSSNVASYSASTPTTGKPLDSNGVYTPGTGNANGTLRTVYEAEVTVSSTTYHLFPGEEIPAGATVKSGGDFGLGEVYIEQDDVLCKVMTRMPPYMSAFSVGTSFFNARSLTENHYLTFGHNTLEYLKGMPFITVKKA